MNPTGPNRRSRPATCGDGRRRTGIGSPRVADQDGLIGDTVIETSLGRIGNAELHEKGFMRITAEDGPVDIEIRLSVASLVDAGWTPPDFQAWLAACKQERGDDAS